LIRAWERRYNVVQPGRSNTNRRLYSQEDIARLALLKAARTNGQSISNAARLDPGRLSRTAFTRTPETSAPIAPQMTSRHLQAHKAVLSSCLDAARQMDPSRLEDSLRTGAVLLTRMQLLSEVIAPLMERIGAEWADGSLKIAHEHMASRVVTGFLWNTLVGSPVEENERRMLLATPAGQWCEIGVLSAALIGADCGWAPLYLGPNLPAEEIAAAALFKNAGAIALGITCSMPEGRMDGEIARLRNAVGPEIAILIGGRAAADCRRAVKEHGAVLLGSLQEFQAHITQSGRG
jgi:DNA-binding transcriptional MerR regulator/methylmalonyl-CoA mutase cobalamin-binding subunit